MGVMKYGPARLRSVLMFVLVFGSVVCHAQLGTGTLNGTVTDSTGAVVPGATLTLIDTDTNATRKIKSNGAGYFSLPELPIGKYSLSATAPGFGTITRNNIELSVGAQLTVDLPLAVGASNVTVEVRTAEAQVNSTSGEQSSLIDPKQIRDLPLNGRNVEQLILLAPGAQPSPATSQGSVFGRSASYSISGARPEGSLFLLDGADSEGYWDRGTGASLIGTSLGIEAIAEFQTLTGIYGAQFGGNGAVINAVTKSGTNDIHGSAYDFLRNSVFDARNYFDPLSGVPSFRRNQFGGSVGLPFRKDKTFFFINYEGLRQQLGRSYTSIVPDGEAHLGYIPCAAASATCVNTGGNLYTHIGVSPVIVPYLAFFPLPNLGPVNSGTGVGQYRFTADNPVGENYVNTRLDQNISAKDSFAIRYLSDNGSLIDPVPGGLLSGFPELSLQRNRYVTLENKYIKSSRLLNVSRFHFVRSGQAVRQSAENPMYAPLQFSPGFSQVGTIVIGALTPSGLGNVDLGPGYATPLVFVQNRFALQNDVFLTLKSHQIQTGIDVDRVQNNTVTSIYEGVQYNFPSIALFLAATPAVAVAALPGSDPERGGREIDINPYIQDDWKVNSRLSLNIGVRYDFVTNPIEDRGKFDAILNVATSTGFTQVPHAFLSNPSLKNIDPRFGFSYLPFQNNQRTAIRGGFGIFHDPIGGRTYMSTYDLSPPYNFRSIVRPTFPNAFAGGIPGAASITPGVPYNTTNTPSQMQYSLGIQQQLDSSTVLTISYVGNQGRHLFGSRDNNPVIPEFCPCTDPANPAASLLPAGTQYQPVGFKRGNPNFAALNLSPAALTSHYNSLQTSLVRQLSHSVQFQINYTFSKVMDYSSLQNGLEALNGSGPIQNPYNVKADYGPAAFDIRHVGTANVIYVVPTRHENYLLSGWQATLLAQLRTGSPYNVVEGFDQAQINNSQVSERPNLVGNPNQPGTIAGNPTCIAPTTIHNATHYYNPCAFVLQPAGTFGTERRDQLYAEGLQEFDVGLFKNTTIHHVYERDIDLQLRAEVFNVLNHTNLGFPNFTLFTSAVPISGVNSLAGSANSTNNNTSRQAQFSLKVLF